MFLELSMILVGVLDTVINSEETFNCSDGVIQYVRPNVGWKSWIAAQNVCRSLSATLPITSNSNLQRCFAEAFSHFGFDKTHFVWIGANSTGGDHSAWRWVDGNQYNGAEIQNVSYERSYASITNGIKINASKPTEEYGYICQFSNSNCTTKGGQLHYQDGRRCFVKYDATMSWFSARNKCLSNSGDLASFYDLFPLNKLNDLNNTKHYWVGLRSSFWSWFDAVTGMTINVTDTLWTNGQPDGNYSQCMSTDQTGDQTIDIRWRDWDCSANLTFICQVSPFSSESTTKTTTLSAASVESVSLKETTEKERPLKNGNSNGKGNNTLGIGLGVGLGVGIPLIIASIIVIVLLVRKHQNIKPYPTADRRTVGNRVNDETQFSTTPDPTEGNYAIVRKPNTGQMSVSDQSSSNVNYAELNFSNT